MIKYKLEEICNLKSGGTPRRGVHEYYGGDIPWVKISDFKNIESDFLIKTEETITQKGLESINDRMFKKGTLLLAMYGSVGKTAITGIDTSCNQAILGITAKNEDILNLKYLKYWLELNQERLVNQARGGTLNNISATIVKKQEILLPDLQIQNKIVAILGKANSLLQKRNQSIQLLNELLRSQFLEMFGDPVIATKHDNIELKYYLKKIQIGPFGSQVHRKDYILNGIPLVNPINIISKRIIPNFNITLTKEKFNSLPNYHLMEGDIIMARRGEMGRCGLITSKEHGWFCGTGSLYLRPKDKSHSLFLLYALSDANTIKYLNRNAKGVTMKNLNKTIISNIPIVKCSDEIILKFNIFHNKIQLKKDQLFKSNRNLQNLFNSILQRAFNGELNFNVDAELDILLEAIDIEKEENDIRDITIVYASRLLERLDTQKFENQLQYHKAKHVAFQMLKEGKLKQSYQKNNQSVKFEFS